MNALENLSHGVLEEMRYWLPIAHDALMQANKDEHEDGGGVGTCHCEVAKRWQAVDKHLRMQPRIIKRRLLTGKRTLVDYQEIIFPHEEAENICEVRCEFRGEAVSVIGPSEADEGQDALSRLIRILDRREAGAAQ